MLGLCASEDENLCIYIYNTHSILVIINDVCQKKMRIFFRGRFSTPHDDEPGTSSS